MPTLRYIKNDILSISNPVKAYNNFESLLKFKKDPG